MSAIAICLVGMTVVVGGILLFRLHAFLALLLGALVVALLTPDAALLATEQADGPEGLARMSASARVAAGFAGGCGKVGILIALAAIIGQCLLVSGSAERIVNAICALFGAKRAPLAFLGSGFVLGVPVFFDTVFYLMIPLVRAFAKTTPKMFLLALLAVVAGGSMAHSLVPPTPGPLFVAEELGVDLGVMIPAGVLLGLVTISTGYLYARWANAAFKIPLRDSALTAPEEFTPDPGRPLPPLALAVLPVAGPLVLIALATFADSLGRSSPALDFLGDKNIALGLGALAAILVAIRFRPPALSLAKVVQAALAGGGVIILITAGGAAFGMVMRQTNVAEELSALFPATGSALLLVAFLLTALVRIAQGSATVAMITSVGIVAPLVGQIELGFHPVYLALAIGCGSKPGPWMNDSGFWVVGRMSGMTEAETLKTFSVMLTIMGLVGFLVVWSASSVLPL